MGEGSNHLHAAVHCGVLSQAYQFGNCGCSKVSMDTELIASICTYGFQPDA